MYTYAQNFEDVMLDRLFHEQTTGFYIDVGDWDPNMQSVTKHFYKGCWRGSNIEPLRSKFELVERERPRVNLYVAVGDAPGKMRFFECMAESYLSGTDLLRRSRGRKTASASARSTSSDLLPVVTTPFPKSME